MHSKTIAVLGAGPMGLAVAYQLARDGHRPVVFEADDRIGGMTAAFDFDGTLIERYYHFHCTSDHEFLKVLGELQLQDKMHWKETKMGYWYRGRLQAWGNPLALLRFEGLGLIAKLRYGLHAFLCTRRTNWKPLDELEATAWIRRWVGEEAYEVLWRRLFDYKFHGYRDKLSAAWIWSRIRRVGRSRFNLMREKLGYLEGGSDTLLQAMRSDIESHGGLVRLSQPISKVVTMDGRLAGIECNGKIEAFDTVVSTVPLPNIPRLIPDLPPAVLAQYRALKNIAVVCVIVKLRKPVSKNFWINTNDDGMDIPGLVEYSNLRPLGQHIVYAPFYMPGDHPMFAEADQAFIDKVKRYLRKINPELGEDDFLAGRASRYRNAQPICTPGFLAGLPPDKLPIEGLWAADTSYYYPEDRGISESIGYGRNLARRVVQALQ